MSSKWLKLTSDFKIYADYFYRLKFSNPLFSIVIFGEWLNILPVFYYCRLFLYRLKFLPTIINADFFYRLSNQYPIPQLNFRLSIRPLVHYSTRYSLWFAKTISTVKFVDFYGEEMQEYLRWEELKKLLSMREYLRSRHKIFLWCKARVYLFSS